MKRGFDFLCALFLGMFLLVPMLLIGLLIRFSTNGPALYWSKRVGKDNYFFEMPKFRTMKPETPQVATHLLENPDQWLTPIGRFLRSTSLDELPQIWNILKGEMSFVGPRPALFNQNDLVSLRTKEGIHKLVPGLTGWAQINGRDDLDIPEKVEMEKHYLKNHTLLFDFKILVLTFLKVWKREGVKH